MGIARRATELVNAARKARTDFGKPIVRQVCEILRYRRQPNLLSPFEYYDYGLADIRYSAADLRRFLGYRAFNLYKHLDAPGWHATANDKLLFHAIMHYSGMATPRVYAVLSRKPRPVENAQELSSETQLHEFLAAARLFPLIIKPVHGYFGRGIQLVHAYDSRSRELSLADRRISLTDLLSELDQFLDAGLLIQEQLAPSTEMAEVVGSRLSSVRFITLLTEQEPVLLGVNWKIPTADNFVDNTAGWTNGNLVACIDEDTNLVNHICRGIDGNIVPDITHHPDTGKCLVGEPIPCFEAQKQFALKAATLFPRLGLQGWDIVSSERGVVALEVNLVTESTVHATQLVGKRGLLNPALEQALQLS